MRARASAAGVQLAGEAVGIGPAGGCLAGTEVGDVEDLAGGPAEGDAVAVVGGDVGFAVDGQALVGVGPVEAVAGPGSRIGVLGPAPVIQHGPDVGSVVG